jgi:hypothetical protein
MLSEPIITETIKSSRALIPPYYGYSGCGHAKIEIEIEIVVLASTSVCVEARCMR